MNDVAGGQFGSPGIESPSTNLSSQAEVPISVEASLVENTGVPVEGADYAANLSTKVVTIPDKVAFHDLGGGDIGSPSQTICRLEDPGGECR